MADQELNWFNAEHCAVGSVLKGFESYLSTKDTLKRRGPKPFKASDRLFSLSSKTSPVVSHRQPADSVISKRRGLRVVKFWLFGRLPADVFVKNTHALLVTPFLPHLIITTWR